tara:strand:- start:160 stop:1092 length:933 start_codon:yes stop_codon:yes gene_type:complete
MKILLLGCSGFIGKELIQRLLKEKHNICVVSRKNIDQLKLRNSLNEINFLKLDVTIKKNWSDENLITKLKDSDGIINLIGEPIADKRWTDTQKIEIQKSRINTTKYLMANLKSLKINPKFIINASAIGYYGTSLENEFTEESKSGSDFLAKLCNDWEQEALKKPFFTRLVIFRIGIVLGKDGGALGKMLPIFKLGLGGPIGDGNQWMSWIHRDDLCGLIIDAIKDKKYSGIFNAVAPEPVKMKEFSSELASSLKRPNLLPVPGATLKLILGDGAKLVLEGQKVISLRLKNNFYKFKYPTLQNALSALTKN